jgi:acyl-CoA dehydrogenase
MFDFRLSPEQVEIRDAVRDFVAREVKPAALEPRRLEAFAKPLLTELLGQASRIGLRTASLSEEAGGAGAGTLTRCLVTEELAVGDPDIAAVLATTAMLARGLEQRMTPAQFGRFRGQFLEDHQFHLALAAREPGEETALGARYHRPGPPRAPARTKAERRGGQWVLNGAKTAVGNAPIAKLFAVRADVPEAGGACVLLVPRETPGLSVRAQERPWAHGACGDVTFDDCRLAEDSVVRGEALSGMEAGPDFQALNLGIGRAACEAALEYAKLRVQGGRRIIEHQAIGAKLAGIAVRLEVARAAIWRAAWAYDHPDALTDQGLSAASLQAIARIFTAQAVLEATKDAAECFGAMGVMRDMPLQKYLHDARVCLHSGDGVADAELRLAEALAGFSRED